MIENIIYRYSLSLSHSLCKIISDISELGNSDNNFKDILELGTGNGISACYIAAALDENSSGLITTMDKLYAKNMDVNILKLLDITKFHKYVKPVFTDSTYNWELMKLIKKRTINGRCKPIFDFCFLDGAHTWEVDGCAFFLAEKLLKPGGWMLFDDLDWNFQKMLRQGFKDEWIMEIPEEERRVCQAGKIFSLLVQQHPNFTNVKKEGSRYGWARKRK